MKKVFATLLALALATAIPVSASALYTELDDPSVYTGDEEEPFYAEDDGVIRQTAGNRTMTVGQTADLNSYILYKDYYNKDLGEEGQWSIMSEKTWSTSNERVATITQGGVVTANRIGNAKITVTFWNSFGEQVVQTIRIKVVATQGAAPDLSYSFEIQEGKHIDVSQAVLKDVSGVVWTTKNETVATVDANGIVLARRHGSTTITGSYTNADGEVVSQQISLKVTSALVTNLEGNISITIRQGDSVNLKKLFYPSYTNSAAYGVFGCRTTNAQVALVGGDSVTGVGTGSCTVTIGLSDYRSEADQFDLDESQKIKITVIP